AGQHSSSFWNQLFPAPLVLCRLRAGFTIRVLVSLGPASAAGRGRAGTAVFWLAGSGAPERQCAPVPNRFSFFQVRRVFVSQPLSASGATRRLKHRGCV